MKYILAFSVLLIQNIYQSAFSQNLKLFVGEIHGRRLDSFRKIEIIPDSEFRLSPISTSKYLIEIRLYETDFPVGPRACVIFMYDTVFRRSAFILPLYRDSLTKPKIIPAVQADLDSVFDRLVSRGIFSIESEDDYDIFDGYKPQIFDSSGLHKAPKIGVNDGTSYFLEFKVDKYYDQESFWNPEVLVKIYKDNQMIRRQNDIVAALKEGLGLPTLSSSGK